MNEGRCARGERCCVASRLMLLALVLLTSGLLGARAQDPATGAPRRGDYDRAVTFFHQIQAAVRTNDPKAVAPLIHYPLRAMIHGHSVLIRNRASFLSRYPEIFTDSRRAEIVNAAEGQLWWRDQGYSVPSGVIWFDVFMPPGRSFPPVHSPGFNSAGKFGIETVNQSKAESR